MFKLEKVFQNDDKAFILYINILKSFLILLLYYCFSILEKNSIYELLDFALYRQSDFFIYSLSISLLFFMTSSILNKKTHYDKNLLSFLRDDILNFIISTFLCFVIFLILKFNFIFNIKFLYLFIFTILILFIAKNYFNYLYKKLINENIIQKNIMLVGKCDEIVKILKDSFDKIFIFKCCIITDIKNYDVRLLKTEIKIPIFKQDDDIRSILEYHFLGQIWVINGDNKEKETLFKNILRYSVDTLNINLRSSNNKKNELLLGNKYQYKYYEKSRFYGLSLFFKIIIDKFLSILFLLLALPIIILSSIFIYIEDGAPLFFTQDRTGWDGRRFRVYKLRSLYNKKYDPISQVTKDDERKLKIGKIIRKYSIDEIPQLFNVLKGEMSLVGPRPHPVILDLSYSTIYESFLTRYRCNPGLTGWAQINGLRGATPDPKLMEKRMDFDLWYLNNWSIGLDFYIIFKTFYALFKYKGD